MKWLLAIATFTAIGCHVNVEDTPVQKQSTTSVTSSPKEVIPKPTPAPAAQVQKKGFNPNRIHQLYDLRTTTLTINGQKLTAYLMDNDSLRSEGFMFVKDQDVQPNQAMLFVFPDSSERGFWMHNTIMPLDIAYIGSDKVVVSATTMKPLDESNVPSHGKAMYALEMKKGTIQRLGIRKGAKVDIPADVKAIE